MRRTFCWATLAIGVSVGMSGTAHAQSMMGGSDWLKQFPIPAGTPGYTTPGVANPLDGVGSAPRSDWLRDYTQGTGAYARSPSGFGFSKQTNGPTTTYTWFRPGANNYNGGGVGYQSATSIGHGLMPINPTLLNPQQNIAGYNPGAAVVRVRTANPFAPYQMTVMPANILRPGNFGR